jgi:hypothetical protein
MNMRIKQALAGIALTGLVWAAPARAAVIFSNFGAGDSFDTSIGWTVQDGVQIPAVQFTAGTSASLDSIDFGAFLTSGANELDVVVMTNGASNRPNAVVESRHLSGALTSFSGIHSVSSGAHPILCAGTKYWLVLSVASGIKVGWNKDSTGASGPFSTRASFGTNEAGWFAPNTEVQGVFRLNGTPAACGGTTTTTTVSGTTSTTTGGGGTTTTTLPVTCLPPNAQLSCGGPAKAQLSWSSRNPSVIRLFVSGAHCPAPPRCGSSSPGQLVSVPPLTITIADASNPQKTVTGTINDPGVNPRGCPGSSDTYRGVARFRLIYGAATTFVGKLPASQAGTTPPALLTGATLPLTVTLSDRCGGLAQTTVVHCTKRSSASAVSLRCSS